MKVCDTGDTLGNLVQLWIKVQTQSCVRAFQGKHYCQIIAAGGCGRVKSALHSYGIKSHAPLKSYAPPVTAVTAWEPVANLDQLYIPCRAITWALSQQYLQNYGLLFRKWVFYANTDLLTSARYRPIERTLLKLQFHMA